MLMDRDLVPPGRRRTGCTHRADCAPWKMEYDVAASAAQPRARSAPARRPRRPDVIRDAVTTFQPDVTFNLLEGFRDFHCFDQHVVSYLELIQQPYTGCNPRGLTLARDKALTKKILAYHRIRVPAFAVFPQRPGEPRRTSCRSRCWSSRVNVEGSIGIAQASIVHDDEQLSERVPIIHEQLDTAAIAEQYVDGRELYVGVMGNHRLRTLPGVGAASSKRPRRHAADRHQQGQVRPRLPEALGHHQPRRRQEACPKGSSATIPTSASASTASSASPATPASTSA